MRINSRASVYLILSCMGLLLLDRNLDSGGLLFGAAGSSNRDGVVRGSLGQLEAAATTGDSGDCSERSEQQKAQCDPASALFTRDEEYADQGQCRRGQWPVNSGCGCGWRSRLNGQRRTGGGVAGRE